MMPAAFHFLRPDWLLAIAPGVVLAVLAWRAIGAGRNLWAGVVDAHLLNHLLLTEKARGRRWPVAALLVGWVLAALAMAGPAWQKLPTPAVGRLDPTVVVLSLAQSMNAVDQSPNRLTAARHKIEDILRRMRGGQVGLIVFADAPFIASPLTEDGRIVGQMLPELATDLMPVLDNRPDLAIAKAVDLLKSAGATAGRIVLITDEAGDRPDATLAAARAAAGAGYDVSVVGVGTAAGSPLLGFDGGVLRARDGSEITTRMDEPRLSEIAAAGHGTFAPLSADGRDLDRILANGQASRADTSVLNTGLAADQWADMGPWLVIPLALLAALAFRRGWVAIVLLAALAGGDGRARAGPPDAPPAAGIQAPGASAPVPSAPVASAPSPWTNLWQTPDQQGAQAFAGSDYGAAASRFQNPDWQASALYKGGDYEKAASAFSRLPGGDYNAGNALARAGKLEEALRAYDAALKANPGDGDAQHNRDLVQRLLDQKKKDENKSEDKSDQGGGQGKDDKQKSDDKQGSDDQKKSDDGKKGPDQNKPDDQKPGDQKGADQKDDPKGDQRQQGQQNQPPKVQDAKAPEPKAPDPKPAGNTPPAQPPKPEQAKQDPAKQDPAKPEQAKPQQPASPPPQPSQAAQAKPGDPPQPPPPPAQAVRGIQPLTEQDQNREQTLRLVPDDPTGLLRARIRSHYSGGAIAIPGVE